MSNMTVKVEFLAGTDIKDAIEEAHQKAVKWDVAYVCFNFNGVSVSVRPHLCFIDYDIDIAKKRVMQALSSELKIVII